MRTIGCQTQLRGAYSLVVTRVAPAPSEICEELPAWITPSSSKTVGSFAERLESSASPNPFVLGEDVGDRSESAR